VAAINTHIFRGSSVVEQSAVNRSAVGSNPTRGAKILGSVPGLGSEPFALLSAAV
jgi:hypothetical protein